MSPFFAAVVAACSRAPSVDATLHAGAAAFEGHHRRAIAVPSGASARGLDPVAVASACDGRLGDVQTGPRWRPVQALDDSPSATVCGAPVWVEVRQVHPEGPDALLIIVDTLRADHVSPERSPAIWAHAVAGWFPEASWSPSPWTLPSVAALFTGRPPWAIMAPHDEHLPEAHHTLAELVEGRTRWMLTSNPYTYASRGFAQGFDRHADLLDDDQVIDTLTTWWSEPRTGPRLAVAHLMGPHQPYLPRVPPPGGSPRVKDQFWDLEGADSYTDPADRARIAELYAAVVAETDERVARLLGLVGEDAVVAIVSDHGEELYEHDGFEHGHALWPEVVRVHAAIRGPGIPPSRPPGPVRLQDVGQELGRALGVAEQASWAPPSEVVLLGYPLHTRSRILHTRGVVAPEGMLFEGAESWHEGDLDKLHRRLRVAEKTEWRLDRRGRFTCDLTVHEGVELRVPSGAAWADESPPGSWGLARHDPEGITITPVRSGSWRLFDAELPGCRWESAEAPRDFGEIATQRLKALGYLD